ncbi:MAG: hypothetical protein AAGB27_04900 [Pseudomonadota bacterium]
MRSKVMNNLSKAIVLVAPLAWPLVSAADAPASPQAGTVAAAQAASVPADPLWPYPVPAPTLEDLPPEVADEGRETDADSDEIRQQVAAARRLSQKVIDGYSRQIDDCRFTNTLHFDDREQVRLIGNSQPCQSRYWNLISQERASLRRRISELRGGDASGGFHPIQLSP